MSFTRTVEQRAYDHLYDPVYTTPTTGLYRTTNPPVLAGAEPGNIVSGTGRHKYFKQPIVPHLHSVPPAVLLSAETGVDPMVPLEEEGINGSVSVGVQTKYRDGEAQTNPYTPGYFVAEGNANPEVLLLDGLTDEDGLQLGVKEVNMIEMSRAKRLLTLSLPPITDEASLELRKRLMEQQEVAEFQVRETEFDSMRQKRLAVLRLAIDERDAGNEFLAEQRVEALRQRCMEKRDKTLQRIQNRRILALRKLSKKRGQVMKEIPGGIGGRKRRDIIEEYADAASTVYAPVRREGQALDKGGGKFDVLTKTQELNSLDTLAAMESTIPKKLLNTVVAKPNKGKTVKNAKFRKELALTSDLQLMDTIIKDTVIKNMGGEGGEEEEELQVVQQSSPSWKTKVRRAERPATPRVTGEDDEGKDEREKEDIALLLLQRLLRGRAVQNTMYEGKERRIALITELRREGEEEIKSELEKRKEKVHSAAIDTIAGVTTSSLMDFFAKDLVRKEEKSRIEEIATKADKERGEREVVEGGRRQAEELQRGREDEAYRQVMRVHHAAASSYVEEIFGNAIDKIVERMVAKLASGAVSVAGETNVAGTGQALIGSFLEPAAANVAEKAAGDDDRLKAAAHDAVGGAVEDVTKYSAL